MATIRNKILIIEDDALIARSLKNTLQINGYEAVTAACAAEGLSTAAGHCPDCILLDLGLPDRDGIEVIRELRTWTATPIVVLSARSTETDKAGALDAGADDYLVKPFGTVELLARIRTSLRHALAASENSQVRAQSVYAVRDLVVDMKRFKVFLRGKDVGLTPIEFRIVEFLAKNAGRVMTYKSIMCELWGPYTGSNNKLLRVHMANIRRKIEPDPNAPCYICTETGIGYRLTEE